MILRPSFYNLCSLDFLNLIWPLTHNPHQKDLDGTEDVHGPGERGAQIETQSHSTSKLRAQRSWDHVVRASSWGKHHQTLLNVTPDDKPSRADRMTFIQWCTSTGNHWYNYNKHYNQPCCLGLWGLNAISFLNTCWEYNTVIPGTTPFVAMALIDMAVNIVWKNKGSQYKY